MNKARSALYLALLLHASASLALEYDFSGSIGLEARAFYEDAALSEQNDTPVSVNFEPELYLAWNNQRDTFTFKPYFRYDSVDDERTHADIREAFWLHVFDNWELGAGINKVYWGVTETQHLVDIINQTDLVEAPDGEEKLGQPMISASTVQDWGIIDAYLLPGFRERTFPGEEGRLRALTNIDINNAEYESGDEDKHIDAALRWSNSIDIFDIGLSGFWGTSREPLFIPVTSGGRTKLQPYYEQIQQYGVDLQAITGSWLWKFEGIYRESNSQEFHALTAGFEYTFVGIFDQIWDLGLLAEYSYDSRDEGMSGALQDDIFVGGRWAFNDSASSEILFGVIQDLESDSGLSAFVEANTRVNENIKIYVEARTFSSEEPLDPIYQIREDSYIEVSASYYF